MFLQKKCSVCFIRSYSFNFARFILKKKSLENDIESSERMILFLLSVSTECGANNPRVEGGQILSQAGLDDTLDSRKVAFSISENW